MEKVFIRELAYRLNCASAFELLTSPMWAHVSNRITVFYGDEEIHLPTAPANPDEVWFTCWDDFGYIDRHLTRGIAQELRMYRSEYLKLSGASDESPNPPPEEEYIKVDSKTVLTITVIALCAIGLASLYYRSDFYQPKK